MKVIQFVLAVCVSVFASTATAQTEQTTGNLVTNTWSGAINYTGSGGGTSGGASAGYNSSTGTIYFGYTQQTVNQLIGINTALQGSGLQVNGYNWSWEVYNNNGGRTDQSGVDTLTANIFTLSPSNQVLHTFSQTYNTKFNWTTFSGTQTYTNPYQATDLGNIQLQFSGRDTGFWAGYYGPQVRNINLSLNYTVDQCSVNPQSSPSCPGFRTYYTFSDDSYVHVPLPFGFPFYGQLFTDSWMHSNGVVSFLNPTAPISGGSNPGAWAYCCSGPDLSQNTTSFGAQFNYLIAPLWTDLYPVASSQFYTTKDSTYIRYHWDNIAEISNMNNLNTFSLELRPTGYYGIQHNSINIQNQNVTIGAIGNLQLDEKNHHYFGIPSSASGLWSVNSTQATDCSNPLNNSACPGYQEAYFNQQCSINPLYNNTCPGYASAYFNQQCGLDPIYNQNCPGYATAYYDYQCYLDSLYHSGCPGYASAYFNQQCGLDPLYNQNCPGYEQAFFDQQCSLNPLYDNLCPGYADAFYVQQCNLNPLYDSGCTGYEQAYFDQQCSLNALYDSTCPGYEVAYFNQQCSNDALYDKNCPGYAEAFALKELLNKKEEPVDKVIVATVSETTTKVEIVEQLQQPQAASASPADVSAPVQLVSTKPSEATSNVTSTSTTSSSTNTSSSSNTERKEAPRTTRQQLAERRLEAAKNATQQAARESQSTASEQMDSAVSMEQQAEIQNVVIGAMGFVPGFDVYSNVRIPDTVFYKPFEIYKGNTNVDNRRMLRGLSSRSDMLHNEMVNQQYNNLPRE